MDISHNFIVLSLEHEYIKLPSLLNSTELTVCSCPFRVFMQVRVSKFHTFIDKSDEQVASSLPIASKAIAFILFE